MNFLLAIIVFPKSVSLTSYWPGMYACRIGVGKLVTDVSAMYTSEGPMRWGTLYSESLHWKPGISVVVIISGIGAM